MKSRWTEAYEKEEEADLYDVMAHLRDEGRGGATPTAAAMLAAAELLQEFADMLDIDATATVVGPKEYRT